MRLPGFSAEQSVRSNSETYQAADTYAVSIAGGAVRPQFFFCRGDYCCNEWGYCIYRGHVFM